MSKFCSSCGAECQDSQYGELSDWVYGFFPAMKTVDILYGIGALVLAGFSIYVRMRLAGFYRNGPKLYYILMAIAIVISLIYIIAVLSIIKSNPITSGVSPDLTSYISSTVTSAIMIVVNYIYFKNRAHLFVN